MNHIREKLPDMKARLNTLMGQTQQELSAFGDATFLGEQHRVSLILPVLGCELTRRVRSSSNS
jgi:dynamin 1-like protein